MGRNDKYTETNCDTKTVKGGKILLSENSSEILGSVARYKLFAMRRSCVYQIYVSYRREHAASVIHCGRETAEGIYNSVVNGTVTPCSLTFVVNDLMPEE